MLVYQYFGCCFAKGLIIFFFKYIKARIDKKHEILEIGCGWGSLAIEVVKQTGCKYTGITLSKEQLKLAEKRVKDAGLQVLNFINFLI